MNLTGAFISSRILWLIVDARARRQKNRDGLAWFARRASAWLLKKVKERKMVKGQANEETCKASGNWKIRVPGEKDFGSERMNDALILDCCLYFRRGRRTFLCSADKNLCFETENAMAGIPTIPPSRNWSSREIAYLLCGGYDIDLSYFAVYKISYKDPKSNTVVPLPVDDDDNMMMVDDDASVAETPEPSHALDLLHFQVIDHFTRLLVELVGRVGVPEIRQRQQADDSTFASRHAPPRSKTRYTEWSVAEILEYLNEKKKTAATSPRVEVFLSKPYAKGARRGQDWSRRDWEVALEGLGRIGVAWEEASIGESLVVLDRHVEGVFARKMRPTGI
ncbi:hypothetical protein DXG03_000313 [Asterophora parasitica]|uniref:PIN domain-containing protein n=1 Tax=Asterophora parasitica TaxID=117018 RepID=A0A9P7GG11_9AGAR|nr:hypothetical protein DXG03_000313 [Asterophora parasitica]